MVHPATFFFVYPSRKLAMDHCQIIRESRDRTYRHAMRDQNNGHATLSRSEIEREAMRITMAGHHREIKAAVLKDFAIARVVTGKLNNTQDLEELVASESPHEFEDTSRRAVLRERAPGCRVRTVAEFQFRPV